MTDSVDNLLLEHLKAIRLELADVKSDTADIKSRLRSLDSSMIDLRRNDLHGHEEIARQQVSIDQIVERLQRIEKRLELS
jgi:chromosome segregation ATPase